MKALRVPFILAAALTLAMAGCAPSSEDMYSIPADYAIASGILYKTVDSVELRLDVYAPAQLLGEDPWVRYSDPPKPVLIFFHGGGWVSGDRISRSLYLLPYLQKGWCAVNVDYRLADGVHANIEDCAADCREAVNWAFRNAGAFRFDTTKIYLSGESAGGHLAMLTAYKFEYPEPIAGIINWFGISDMDELYGYWNDTAFFARLTAGAQGNVHEVLQRNSPIRFTEGKPIPLISIHGDQDYGVPITQSENIHQVLQNHQVKNKLVVIKGKKHGNFSPEDLSLAYSAIWDFVE